MALHPHREASEVFARGFSMSDAPRRMWRFCSIRRGICGASAIGRWIRIWFQNELQERIMTFELTSSAIHANEQIPTRFSCDGAHISPPLAWSGAPVNTATFALIVDDPDAPGGTFTHWVLFNLPRDVDHLDENIPSEPELDNGAVQGRNDFGRSGYGAPCPPRGETHRYRFTLNALNAPLPLPAGATRQQVLQAMQPHVLDQVQIVSTYHRQS
jgi:Raf kinase inhibitor-like YbhB/YbcL family protein